MRPLVLLFSSGLLACATLGPGPLDPGPALLPPRAAGFSGVLTEEIGLRRGERTLDTLATVTVDSAAVTVLGLNPLGAREYFFQWDGAKLEQKLDPALPRGLRADQVLRDLQYAYWPEEAVRATLPAGWLLASSEGKREFLSHGKVIISIRYGEDRFRDLIELKHESEGYTRTFRTLVRGGP